jgi:cysteine desulfurase/selenocysteine lyase
MNTAAYSWGFYNLEDGDEILLCHDDHQSTILPWLHLSEILAKSGRKIKIIPINIHPHGDYDDDALAASLSPRTRTVIMTHIHSYFGMEMNIAANAANIRKYGKDIKIIIDGTQAAGHIPLDMKKLDCDFYCFSGHKMCALPGAGVLYAARRIHSELHPFIVGGRQKQDSLQSILENGTLNMPAIISLGASIKYLRKIGIQNIAEHISAITHRLANGLSQLPGLQMEKGASMCQCASHGICAFSIDGMTGADLAYILDDHDICVRANDFCLAKERRDTVRASLYFYNTETEVDRFLEIMERCPVPCKSANHLRHRLKT